ncbi:MAG: Cys-tRNA(Pro) deacylase [Hespellia sp.]|nr:Cys-tRNA(Pro) deacylase [Hespellia sp.]
MSKKKEKEVKTNAMRILEKHKISYIVHTYTCDGFIDGVSIADELGQPHELVYKSLVAVGKSKEHYVFVIPIETELDLKAAARAVSEKSIEMLPLKDLTGVTGYVRGGCTAIGMKKDFPAVIDTSAKSLDIMIVSGGRRGSQIELKPEDLAKAARAVFADVTVKEAG